MFERFTDRSRRAIVLAQEEARFLGHNYIGTEHILLGLIREDQGVAAKALESLGISLELVRQQVEEIIGHGQELPPPGHIPFTPRAKKVLELSLREALQLSHSYIGTEHILLGLLREGEGVAAQVLVTLGADLNRVRQQVIQLLRDGAAEAPAGIASLPGFGSAESRLSAVEHWVGMTPDTGELDRQLGQVRSERHAALAAHDHERVAQLRDRERELLAERASRREQWAAELQGLPSLTAQVRQLSEEVEKLRALLREHGREPGQGTA